MAITRLKRKKAKNIFLAKQRKKRLKQLLKTPSLNYNKETSTSTQA